VVDPWNQVTPDHQQSLQSDSLFIWNTVVESAPTCTTGLKAKVTVRNNSKLSSPSILVHASNGGTVKAQTPAAFPIAVGQSKDVIVEPYGAQSGDPTALTLTIVDWTHSLGNHLGAQGVTITPTRSCTLAAALDDAPRQAAH
jgi:hypothetical protein